MKFLDSFFLQMIFVKQLLKRVFVSRVAFFDPTLYNREQEKGCDRDRDAYPFAHRIHSELRA